MRKLILLLALCLLLTGCSSTLYSLSGAVVEVTPEALILDTGIAVLREEDLIFWSPGGLVDGDAYKADPYPGVQIYFFPGAREGTVRAADGRKLKAYRADRPAPTVYIDALLTPDVATLSDGTVLDGWRRDSNGLFDDYCAYQTKDGVTLLNHRSHALYNLHDFPEADRTQIEAYFKTQPPLYGLQHELERAWAAYQADPKEFSAYLAEQNTTPAVHGKQVSYFTCELLLTIKPGLLRQTYHTTALDRETWAPIPLAELFTLPEEQLGKQLLQLAAQAGTGPKDPALLAEMEAAFSLELVRFSGTGLVILFPPDTLPSMKESSYQVNVSYRICGHLLQPWAVPITE